MLKILLALDLSPHSQRAAEYVARVAPHLKGCRVTALVVSSGIPYGAQQSQPVVADESTEPELHGDEDHLQEMKEVQSLLEEIKALLLKSGLDEDNLELRIKPLGRGVALDILDEARALDCDTIVVGRRGLSKVKSLLLGSISSTILQNAEGLTVWVVE
ncbi:Nucleotide-binding universal stress protein, UspA family [Geoalkalibacter ferrihydriticus]|uniref:Nucleotide-binding universal stress protein, UspA family n=1 Tax=Geoalkalibacter ferrihydriticus TaxID=392333 RepID=A0A1G9MTA1_9BACT|nr:universal stress protein [Geoalkalibacter ferrihydriticus]SDL77343.1 Nucleotide-binding universal stress protein, UspA family [Geoalkalibacter ferrihydriticus]